MTWKESLEARIHDKNGSVLFFEAIKCLNATCYRAGYIVGWISIVESLKRRIEEAASIGDKMAGISFAKIEAEEKAKKSTDKLIVEEAKKILLIDGEEYNKLEFLWGQRCIFAHPYSREPTEDDLKYIISQSVDITLSKPLVYKKPYIEELIQNISTEFHFFSNNNDLIRKYAQGVIPRIEPSLYPYMHKTIFGTIGKLLPDNTKDIFVNRLQIFELELLNFTQIPLDNDQWRLEDFAVKQPHATFAAYVHPDLWEKIPLRVKHIIIAYATRDESSESFVYARKKLIYIQKDGKLEKEFTETFSDCIESLPFEEAQDYYVDKSSLLSRIINELSSGFFTKQKIIISFLASSAGRQFTDGLNEAQKIQLGRNCMYAAFSNCFAAQSFVSNINDKDKFLIVGFLIGCFVDKNNILRFQYKYLPQIIKVLDANNDINISHAYSKLISEINICGKDEFSQKESAAVLLENISDNSSNLKEVTIESLKQLVGIIKNMDIPNGNLDFIQ